MAVIMLWRFPTSTSFCQQSTNPVGERNRLVLRIRERIKSLVVRCRGALLLFHVMTPRMDTARVATVDCPNLGRQGFDAFLRYYVETMK